MQSASRFALISVHPEYVKKIVDRSKRVEFRRVWSSQSISHIVLYSTAPEMKVVAILKVGEVVASGVEGLWELAKCHGGGLTRAALRKYFSGKKTGYGIVIEEVEALARPVNIGEVIPGVRPPQSYMYLTEVQFDKVRQWIA